MLMLARHHCPRLLLDQQQLLHEAHRHHHRHAPSHFS
jgi:hypothetical protein